MSKIEEQIKELLRKKSKVELYWHILESLASYKDEAFKDVKEEVLAEVKAFVDAQIDLIEAGKDPLTGRVDNDDLNFSAEEIKVLKQTVKKLLSPKPASPENPYQSKNEPNQQAPQNPKPKTDNRQDKISFALAHRHLANKRVKCQTPDGEVLGTVVGIDAPHIIVRTDTGHTAPIDLDRMQVVNG